MPATIPTRPAAGATIATAWGTDVHDRTYSPLSARATGPSSAVAAGGRLLMDTLAAGSAGAVVGNGLVIAAGGSGLYLFTIAVLVNTQTAGTAARIELRRGGSVLAGFNGIAANGGATRSMVAFVYPVSDGDDWNLVAVDAMTATVSNFTMTRIGNAQG